MNRKTLIFIVSILILVLSAGCDVKSEPKEIAQIIYAVDSGPILPELQAHEVYTITPGTVKLARNGKSSDTQVFEGEWTFTADETLLKDLFATAKSKECNTYKRVESAETPDGGETFSVTLTYADESECTLTYDPGTSYDGAEELLSKVRELIENLKVQPNVVPE
jgi:hypothetical protein